MRTRFISLEDLVDYYGMPFLKEERLPCHCDPPGSGEDCNGACFEGVPRAPLTLTISALYIGGPRDGQRVTNEAPLEARIVVTERRGNYDFGTSRDPFREHNRPDLMRVIEVDQYAPSLGDAGVHVRRRYIRHHVYYLFGTNYHYRGWA